VNHIRAEKQRNMQAALLHGQVLIGVGARLADRVEHRPHAARRRHVHHVKMIGFDRVDGYNHAALVRSSKVRCRLWLAGLLRGRIPGVVVLHQLPDLFFQRHLLEQALHPGFNPGIGQLRVGGMVCLARLLRRRMNCESGYCQTKRTTDEEDANSKVGPKSGIEPHDCGLSVAVFQKTPPNQVLCSGCHGRPILGCAKRKDARLP
jgi:hypothetical protein